jgi:hypothetical protein
MLLAFVIIYELTVAFVVAYQLQACLFTHNLLEQLNNVFQPFLLKQFGGILTYWEK